MDAIPFQPLRCGANHVSRNSLAKKRPSSTKLDLERMHEESIELAAVHQQLRQENRRLKEKYQEVEAAKLQRQTLIFTVENAVLEKSKQLPECVPHPSWLVFKLNSKIYELREKIEQVKRRTRDIQLSRETQQIRQREIGMQCLQNVLNFIQLEGKQERGAGKQERGAGKQERGAGKQEAVSQEVRELVWMDQQTQLKQLAIIEVEKALKAEERKCQKVMRQLAQKNVELRAIKEMQCEYRRVQQIHEEETKRKQQKMAGNKTYAEQLLLKKNQQQEKLVLLQKKFALVEAQEEAAIDELQEEINRLKALHQEKSERNQTEKEPSQRAPPPQKKDKWVKSVSNSAVNPLALTLIYQLSLRGVDLTKVGELVMREGTDLSVSQAVSMLSRWPFRMEKEEEKVLLARYLVEDSGEGLICENLQARQSSLIVKSILCKLLCDLKVYSETEVADLLVKVGSELSKFGKLIQHNLEMPEGSRKFVSRGRMEQAIESAQIFSDVREVGFVLFYLFSWSRDLERMEVARIFLVNNGEGINWDRKDDRQAIEAQ